jgi:hypothetical protein
MNKRVCYIPCRMDEQLLWNAIETLVNQVDGIKIIDNTNEGLQLKIEGMNYNKIKVINPLAPQSYEQSLYIAIKDSIKEGNTDFCLWAHNDILVQDKAINLLFEKYEEIKDTKWGVLWTNYDSLCLFNPKFFINENLWPEGDSLFRGYYGDNNRYRLMELRGYQKYTADQAGVLVNHLGSKTIHNNPRRMRINGITFGLDGQMYSSIWGGLPGHEIINDPTANGFFY